MKFRFITLVGASFWLFAPSTGFAKDLIAVDWKDPEIVAFKQQQKSNPRSLAQAAFDPRMRKLKLPVVGFRSTPKNVTRSLSVAPRAKRQLVMDENNPVWYELSYEYSKDVRITVEADMRVQTTLPDDTKLTPSPDGQPENGAVSVFDDTNEVGMIGIVAEFTVQKFGGIPYTVTVECSERTKAVCKDVDAIRRDQRFLKLISAGK